MIHEKYILKAGFTFTRMRVGIQQILVISLVSLVPLFTFCFVFYSTWQSFTYLIRKSAQKEGQNDPNLRQTKKLQIKLILK